MEATLKHEKSTKGAHKFVEIDDNGNPRGNQDEGTIIGSLYIRKTAMADAPEKLKVTIEEVE